MSDVKSTMEKGKVSRTEQRGVFQICIFTLDLFTELYNHIPRYHVNLTSLLHLYLSWGRPN